MKPMGTRAHGAAAADGQLMAFQHEGFWQPMDTLREKRLPRDLWATGAGAMESVV
jgi:NDP-sugar pyrophosphorylase family protein